MSAIKTFDNIFTARESDSSWNVVQANTLLVAAQNAQSSSLVIYAALETRMAIELLIFEIIAIARGGIDRAALAECKKKDGLFRLLDEFSPKYTLRCMFLKAVRQIERRIPETAEWDIKILKKHYTSLSGLCHSQLIIEDMAKAPDEWSKHVKMVGDALQYLANNMRKRTGIMKFDGASPHVTALWSQFEIGKITYQDVIERLKLIAPLLSGRFEHSKEAIYFHKK